MLAWGTVLVIWATLIVASVDAKIYERCELAKKLERAGLDGYRGYHTGDCETLFSPNPIHAHKPLATLRPKLLLSFFTSLGQGMISGHFLTVMSGLIQL